MRLHARRFRRSAAYGVVLREHAVFADSGMKALRSALWLSRLREARFRWRKNHGMR
jgi:hypothetical protein